MSPVASAGSSGSAVDGEPVSVRAVALSVPSSSTS